MFDALLPTKLYMPPPRPGGVERPRLLERLDAPRPCKLVLVSAPAGYGKTTLVTTWLARVRAAGAALVCWLALDEDDSDPQAFFRYLDAAVRPLPGLGATLPNLLQAAQPLPEKDLARALASDLFSVTKPFYLVLDDYHAIDSAEIEDALAALLELMPPQMTLVLISRSDPGFPLARLRARGELVELRAADLRFTADEAALFMKQTMGLAVRPEQAAALEKRTEGWITGLQMAALSLQNRAGPDLDRFVQGFTGSHRFVLDYLLEEVLRRQPPQARAFLLETAFLDRLSGPLCAAVSGRPDSQTLLEALERENLFLVPLDEQRRWYRYHHLFADVLQAYAQAQEPEQVAARHRRASGWYEAHEQPAEAIRHALAAADFARAADLLELARPAMDGRYQSEQWLAWARMLPDELVRARPVLSTGYAWALLDSGEMALCEERLQDAEKWLDGSPGAEMIVVDQAQFDSLPSSIAAARAYRALALGDVPGTIRHAQQSLDLLPEGEQRWRTAATSLLGLTYWANGDLPQANAILTEFMRMLLEADNPDVTGVAFVLADIQTTLGELREAERTCRRALGFVLDYGEPLLVGAADIYRALADLAREWGDLDTAGGYLQTAVALGQDAALTDWPRRRRLTEARLRHSRGDLPGAIDLLEEADRLAIQTPLPDARPVQAWLARLWAAQGDVDAALAWARERRLAVTDDLDYLREFEHITLASVLLAEYRRAGAGPVLKDALDLLARLAAAAEAGGRTGSLIEILLLQAVAQDAQGQRTAALASLAHALALAEPQGYVRLFLDKGPPLAPLLREAARQNPYAARLLAAAPDGSETAVSQPLVDPLSARELEILALIVAGLKNQEIADQLVISLNTVLYHNKNIYSKLGVNKRALAIAKARELQLLP